MLEGHTDRVVAVAISTDGAKILSGSGDNTVRVWSAETGKVPACLPCMTGHSSVNQSISGFYWMVHSLVLTELVAVG